MKQSVSGCQQCGGTLSPVEGRDYMQCQYCLSLAFLTDNPMAIDRITPLEGEVSTGCPTCKDHTLQMGQLDDHRVLYCEHCYGVLIRNTEFGKLIRDRRARRDSPEYTVPKPVDVRQYERQIHCPNCHQGMEAHPYYGPGNVIIDSCGHCMLVWLDHGELACVERAPGSVHGQRNSLHGGVFESTDRPSSSVANDETNRAPRHALEVIADFIF